MNRQAAALLVMAGVVACIALVGGVSARRLLAPQYPNPKIPEGNTTTFAIAEQSKFLHVFALGSDGALYHKYQPLGGNPPANWTQWILRAKAPGGSKWDADPAVAVAPDGSLEVFIRQLANLDLWQMYQTDASDPNAWSVPRECSCIVMPCNDTNPNDFWNTSPVFPTSDVTITTGPDGWNRLFYRGFDGALYVVDAVQDKTHHYNPPVGFNTVLE